MRHVLNPFVLALVLAGSPGLLRAGVIVTTSLNLTQLQITSSIGTVDLTVSASAFGQVYDSLGGADYGYDPGPVTASTSAATTLANWAGAADSTAFTESSSSGVNIPGGLAASAGTVPGGNYGDLQGTLEITDPSGGTNPVTVNFSAALSGSQYLSTDASGLSATSEVIFNLLVGSTSELFLDSPLSIGSSTTLTNPIGTTLSNSDSTLLTNTPYFVDINADAESYGLNTTAPEPSTVWLAGMACLILLARLRRTLSLSR